MKKSRIEEIKKVKKNQTLNKTNEIKGGLESEISVIEYRPGNSQ